MKGFELSSTVKDKISGAEGVITQAIIMLNGCLRYIVRPKSVTPEGSPTIGFYLFHPECDLVNGKEREYKTHSWMGEEVIDTVSDYKGTVVSHAFNIGIGEQLYICPRGLLDRNGEPAMATAFDIGQLKLVSNPKAKPEESTSEVKTGPSRLSNRGLL